MPRVDELLESALKALPPKPADSAPQAEKKRYSERLSENVARALARELRERGLAEARPADSAEPALAGAERRMGGGLGAKKVDVTWATEESGLLLAISIKSINFRDQRTRNFQKNLVNRRSDMLMEATTLHRRFPYAVLAGFFFLDKDAASDGTAQRHSTLLNAHARLRLFTGRDDPAAREEQFEKFYLLLVDATPHAATVLAYEGGQPDERLELDAVLGTLLMAVAERNADFYEYSDGKLRRAS